MGIGGYREIRNVLITIDMHTYVITHAYLTTPILNTFIFRTFYIEGFRQDFKSKRLVWS